jgi:hypothetical protein
MDVVRRDGGGFSKMRIVVAIAVVLLVGMVVVGAGAIRGDSDDGGDLAFTPDSSASGSAIGVASAMGTSTPSAGGDGWIAKVTVTVTDASDTVIEGARVSGTWSDDSTPAGCVTATDGTCSFEATHAASASNEATWSLASVTKQGHDAAAGNTTKVTCTDPRHAANRDVDGTAPCDALGTL